jgi:hypothetical protein
MKRGTYVFLRVLVIAAASCSSGVAGAPEPSACEPGRGASADVAPFRRYTIDVDAFGPAFVDVGDVDGDGRSDLVVSEFGPTRIDGARVTLSVGRVVAYLQGPSLGCWRAVPIARDSDALHFPNRPTVADVDGDGDNDVVVPAGFFVCAYAPDVGKCGAIVWYENRGGGVEWTRHDVIANGAADAYTGVALADLDGDGARDLVTVGEGTAGSRAIWIRGDASSDRFAKTEETIGEGGGSFPVVRDLDGDGDLDVAGAEYFVANSSIAWFEQTTQRAFARHVVNAEIGRGFALDFVPNLLGDGVTRGLATNHTNTRDGDGSAVESSIFVVDLPGDATRPWTARRASTGIVSRPSVGQAMQGAPGVFGWGDIDGDGDVDIALAGDGDARTFWMEQTTPGAFAMHVLEQSLGQAAGARVVDLDGDGSNELVFTGYEDNVVYVYARPSAR